VRRTAPARRERPKERTSSLTAVNTIGIIAGISPFRRPDHAHLPTAAQAAASRANGATSRGPSRPRAGPALPSTAPRRSPPRHVQFLAGEDPLLLENLRRGRLRALVPEADEEFAAVGALVLAEWQLIPLDRLPDLAVAARRLPCSAVTRSLRPVAPAVLRLDRRPWRAHFLAARRGGRGLPRVLLRTVPMDGRSSCERPGHRVGLAGWARALRPPSPGPRHGDGGGRCAWRSLPPVPPVGGTRDADRRAERKESLMDDGPSPATAAGARPTVLRPISTIRSRCAASGPSL
jgi:hypothetical protein